MSRLLPVGIEALDKVLEAALLLRESERGYAREYRSGSAFGVEEDACRLDAFTLGMLDVLSRRLGERLDPLPLLVYLKTLLDLGPGETARDGSSKMIGLGRVWELRPYVAGGRRLALAMMAGSVRGPGCFARLLEESLESPHSPGS